jgi:hypothetical protein
MPDGPRALGASSDRNHIGFQKIGIKATFFLFGASRRSMNRAVFIFDFVAEDEKIHVISNFSGRIGFWNKTNFATSEGTAKTAQPRASATNPLHQSGTPAAAGVCFWFFVCPQI